MNPGYSEIRPFRLEFNSSEKERQFIEWIYPDQFIFFKKMTYLGVFATFLFIIPDWLKSGDGKSFALSLVSRFFLVISVLAILKLLEKFSNPHWFFRSMLILSFLIGINAVAVIIVMKNHSEIYALSEIIAVIIIYMILRHKFIFALLGALSVSAGFIFVHVFFGNMDSSSLQTVVFAYFLANGIGIIYNRTVSCSTRKEYMSLLSEQALNSRLEKEIKQREAAQQDLLDMARTDYLTGFYNRRFFLTLADQEILKTNRYDQSLSLLTLDIDFFKNINDTYGHQEGDIVLINLADKLRSNIRKSDIVSRIGGEEFVILTPNTSKEEARKFAENLRKMILESDLGSNNKIKITVSIGVADFKSGDTLIQLMQKSDKALYLAKENGRNQVVVDGDHPGRKR